MAQIHARHLIAVCATCLLAACGGTQRTQAPPEPAAATIPQAQPPQTTAPQPAPPREPVRETVRATPATVPIPDTLIGLAPEAVDKLFGKPELVRRDGTAEVRLYADGDRRCTLHVFLYANGKSDQSKAVEYVEGRSQRERLKGADLTDCYRSLAQPAATS